MFILVSIFSDFGSAKAYSPIIASCSNGVLDDDNFFSVGGRAVYQLFEVRLDDYYLDAVSVRLRSGLGTDSAVASVIKRDGPTIATSAAQPVTTTPSWMYFDLPDVQLPRGVYLLSVIGASPEVVVWNKGPGTCIDDSYVIIDGERRQDYDMAFAIYAYKNSDNGSYNPNDSNNSDINNPGETTNGDLPPGEETSLSAPNNKSAGIKSATPESKNSYPSKEDLLKMSNDDSDGVGPWGLLMFSPIVSIILAFVGFLIFVGIIILVIWLITRRKKNQNKPEPNKSSEKEELTKK